MDDEAAAGGEVESAAAEPGSGLRPEDSGRGLRAALTGVSANVMLAGCSVLMTVGEVTVIVDGAGLGPLIGDGLVLGVGDAEAPVFAFFLGFFGGLGLGGLSTISCRAAGGTVNFILFEGLSAGLGLGAACCASVLLDSSWERFGGGCMDISVVAAGSFAFFIEEIESRIPLGLITGAGKGVGNCIGVVVGIFAGFLSFGDRILPFCLK